jgi:hypothetical protein
MVLKGLNALNLVAICSPPLSTLLIAPLIALLMLLLLNSRALTLIINACKSATYTLVLQIPNNANSNINLLFLFILDTAALIKDNIIRLLLY